MVPESVMVGAFEGALAAVVYAMLWYARSREDGESFDPYKFGATLIVGVAIGIALGASGVVVSESTVEQRLFVYAGLISLVEAILKTAARRAQKADLALPV